MNYVTRTAAQKDIPSITAIYNQAIADRKAALETEKCAATGLAKSCLVH